MADGIGLPHGVEVGEAGAGGVESKHHEKVEPDNSEIELSRKGKIY